MLKLPAPRGGRGLLAGRAQGWLERKQLMNEIKIPNWSSAHQAQGSDFLFLFFFPLQTRAGILGQKQKALSTNWFFP